MSSQTKKIVAVVILVLAALAIGYAAIDHYSDKGEYRRLLKEREALDAMVFPFHYVRDEIVPDPATEARRQAAEARRQVIEARLRELRRRNPDWR